MWILIEPTLRRRSRWRLAAVPTSACCMRPTPATCIFGSLLEAGAALGAGKRVYLVSPHDWPFLRHHPRVKSFPDLAAAVTELRVECRSARVSQPCSFQVGIALAPAERH
jgi:hypothetical protein